MIRKSAKIYFTRYEYGEFALNYIILKFLSYCIIKKNMHAHTHGKYAVKHYSLFFNQIFTAWRIKKIRECKSTLKNNAVLATRTKLRISRKFINYMPVPW